ncbi:MAG: ABC transporter permease [Candidatus Helarchaeota archaeon]
MTYIDLKNFFRFTYWIAILMVSYIVDLLIMASTLSNIIIGLDYLKFFGPGITIVAAFSSSFILARKINLEKENKFDYYLLSLPIKRFDFILGRAIAGMVQGLIYSLPLMILTFIIVRIPGFFELCLIIFFFLIFSLSMTFLAIIIATSTRGSRNFTLARSFIYLWLMFGSTIFYPLDIITNYFPPVIIFVLELNPMSFGVNIFRGILFQTKIDIFNVIGIAVFIYDRSTNR